MVVRIINADVMDGLRQLPDESVHCVVTSPPYWGLRDYGVDGQIGLEATPEAFVAALVAVFREVRRVLRTDGTLWLNLGDSYTSGGRDTYGTWQPGSKQATHTAIKSAKRAAQPPGLKPKDLCGIPWRVAFALQADGWWLRSDIIWAKPNPMPESIKDRPTKAHEYVFLLTKSERYFYDAEAIKEPSLYAPGETVEVERAKGYYGGKWAEPHDGSRNDGAFKAIRETRNKRSVWTVPTAPYAEAHFATFPPDLIKPMILAGTSEKGCCSGCGTPLRREEERGESHYARLGKVTGSKLGKTDTDPRNQVNGGGQTRAANGTVPSLKSATRRTVGWSPACDCEGDVQPCTVLDPFSGAGTTAFVSDCLQRNAIGIELNPEYAEMSRKRIAESKGGTISMFADVEVETIEKAADLFAEPEPAQ